MKMANVESVYKNLYDIEVEIEGVIRKFGSLSAEDKWFLWCGDRAAARWTAERWNGERGDRQ